MDKPGVGATIILQNELGEVLLGRRNYVDDPDKFGNNTWCFPGGKVDFGESSLQAARRELYEETGISLPECSFKLISIQEDYDKNRHWVIFYYHVNVMKSEISPINMEPSKNEKWEWLSSNMYEDTLVEGIGLYPQVIKSLRGENYVYSVKRVNL